MILTVRAAGYWLFVLTERTFMNGHVLCEWKQSNRFVYIVYILPCLSLGHYNNGQY